MRDYRSAFVPFIAFCNMRGTSDVGHSIPLLWTSPLGSARYSIESARNMLRAEEHSAELPRAMHRSDSRRGVRLPSATRLASTRVLPHPLFGRAFVAVMETPS